MGWWAREISSLSCRCLSRSTATILPLPMPPHSHPPGSSPQKGLPPPPAAPPQSPRACAPPPRAAPTRRRACCSCATRWRRIAAAAQETGSGRAARRRGRRGVRRRWACHAPRAGRSPRDRFVSTRPVHAHRPPHAHQLDARQVAARCRQRQRRVAVVVSHLQIPRPVGAEVGIVALQVGQQRSQRGGVTCAAAAHHLRPGERRRVSGAASPTARTHAGLPAARPHHGAHGAPSQASTGWRPFWRPAAHWPAAGAGGYALPVLPLDCLPWPLAKCLLAAVAAAAVRAAAAAQLGRLPGRARGLRDHRALLALHRTPQAREETSLAALPLARCVAGRGGWSEVIANLWRDCAGTGGGALRTSQTPHAACCPCPCYAASLLLKQTLLVLRMLAYQLGLALKASAMPRSDP